MVPPLVTERRYPLSVVVPPEPFVTVTLFMPPAPYGYKKALPVVLVEIAATGQLKFWKFDPMEGNGIACPRYRSLPATATGSETSVVGMPAGGALMTPDAVSG